MYGKEICFLVIVLFGVICEGNTCNKHKTCGECVSDPTICVWCSKDNFLKPRCQEKSTMKRKWCDGALYDPQRWTLVNHTDHDLHSSVDGNNIQIKPQFLKYKVRPGAVVNFTLLYKPALDYPLDVYYLMDNSYTMKYHKENLKTQAELIRTNLELISNNVRFGVGSFVEKPNLPYADISHHAYSFTNHLSLTDNMTLFKETVGVIKSGSNSDDPEALFDGLMQTMVCDETGWRDDARHVIVVSTDAPYHSAGDGKFVGAIEPNDKACHLKNNTYTAEESLKYDYPSVNQIHQITIKNKMHVMFVVDKYVLDVYHALEKQMTMSKTVELSKDSNTAELIKNLYMDVIQTLIMKRKNVPSYIDLILDPPCSDEEQCEFKVGDKVEIKASFKVASCPKGGSRNLDQFILNPYGLDGITVQLATDCDCECEKDGKGIANSPKCNGKGTYQCGVCKCNPGWHGEFCECIDSPTSSTIESDLQKCTASKNETLVCSGRGKCQCGTCVQCGNYQGKFCEYSFCPFRMGKACNDHGKCEGETCKCDAGWTGDACDCPLTKDLCIFDNGKECSGHGECVCGVCECNKVESDNKKYTGKYCHYCKECVEERCIQLGKKVECYMDKCNNRTNSHVTHVTYKFHYLNRTDYKDLYKNFHQCKKVLDDGTAIKFKYLDESDTSTIIYIQSEKEAAPVPAYWVHVGTAIGVILAIGLLTALFWKLIVDHQDKKEYDKFAKECESKGFDVAQNPLYQPPGINIRNPAYGMSHE